MFASVGIITAKLGKLENAWGPINRLQAGTARRPTAGTGGQCPPLNSPRKLGGSPFRNGGVVLEPFEEFTNRQVEGGVHEIGSQLGQWNENEASFMKPRMG